MRKIQGAVWTLILLGLVLLGGCGSNNNNSFVAMGGAENVAGPTGNVVVNFTLLQRAVPTTITAFRFIAFDSAGAVVYGPNVVDKQASITLGGVSSDTATFRIEYLDSSGVVRGFYEAPLSVPPNGTVEINDPPFLDVGGIVTLIEVTPVSDVMPVGTTRQFVATAILADGTSTDVTSSAIWSSSDESVVRVSNDTGSQGNASALSAGSANLSATLGDVTGSERVTVSSAVLQSVEVSPTAVVLPIGKTQNYTATGRFSDGTTEDLTDQVLWTSSAGAVASVDNDGLSLALADGTTTITATDSSSGLSGTSNLTVTDSVLTKIQVFPSLATAASGRTVQFSATGVYSDGQEEDVTSLVTWTSSDTGVATISNSSSSDGLASTISEGQTTISARFSGITGQAQLTVESAELESLEISPLNPVVTSGGTVQFKVVGVFTNHTTLDLTKSVAFTSSNTSVAKVSNDAGTRGLATGLSNGQSTITATDPTSGLSANTSIQVGAATLVSIEVTPADSAIAEGLTQQFVAVGTYSDLTTRDISSSVTWSSSSTATATISNSAGSRGLATAVADGTTTITATEPLSSISGNTPLTVSNAVLTSIAVTPVSPDSPLGAPLQFIATGTYSDGTIRDLTSSVNWTSSDEDVVVIENRPVPESGEAEGLKLGQSTITALDSDSGIQDSTVMTVTDAVLERIEVRPANVILLPLEPERFRARGIYSDGSTVNLTRRVVWRSSNILVFIISNVLPGRGLGLLPGDSTVRATLRRRGLEGETTVTITL
jgi:Big-like domain-containing protein